MVKKVLKKAKLSRPSMEHRFDYLLKTVLSEIETQELKKCSPKQEAALEEEFAVNRSGEGF